MANACTGGIDTGFVALGYAKVAILGVVQGITELMPISSTAHMRLVPAVLGWQDPGSAFSAAMQLAALAAVVSYFWTDVRDVAVESPSPPRRAATFAIGISGSSCGSSLATIPIGIAGLALAKAAQHLQFAAARHQRHRLGLHRRWRALLASPNSAARHRRTSNRPPCSMRSCRHRAGRRAHSRRLAFRLDVDRGPHCSASRRDEAARLSFLLGLPAIALAGLKELWELHKAHLDAHGVGGAVRRPRRRLDVGVLRHLGADADPGKFFQLAVRHLSVSARRRHPRRRRSRMGWVTPKLATARPHDSPPSGAP